MWAPSCLGLCTYRTGIHNLLQSLLEVIVGQNTDMGLSLEQFECFWGTWMCKVVLCFYYVAQDGHRNHCPTIHTEMGVSSFWFMPPVDSIITSFS